METVLTVKDLSVTYVNKSRRVMAVRRASFSIDKGDSLGIVGESGSGKSTLAMALLRLHPKSTEITGQALFDGKDLLSISANVKKKMDKRNDCMRRRGDRKIMEDIVRRKKRSPGRGPGR